MYLVVDFICKVKNGEVFYYKLLVFVFVLDGICQGMNDFIQVSIVYILGLC